MSKWKKRLSVILCTAIALTLALGIVPQTELTAEAATKKDVAYWSGYYGEPSAVPEFKVEKGQKFYIGDYAIYYTWSEVVTGDEAYEEDDYNYCFSELGKVKYKSSKKSVASVTSKGKVTAKKKGTTTIKIKAKGKVLTCNLTVVGKNELGSNKKEYKAYRKAINKYTKLASKSITASNRYKAYNDSMKMWKKITEYRKKDIYPSIEENGVESLIVPNYGRYMCLDSKVWNYINKYNSISSYYKKNAQVKSVAVNKGNKSLTVTLKKKMTSKNIFAVRAWENYDKVLENYYKTDKVEPKNLKSGKTAKIDVCAVDANGKVYPGTLTFKSGSKKATVKMASQLPAGTYALYDRYNTEDDGSVGYGCNWMTTGENGLAFTVK